MLLYARDLVVLNRSCCLLHIGRGLRCENSQSMQVRCAGSLGAAACAWVYDVVDLQPTRDTRAAWLTAHHTSAATALFPWSYRLDLPRRQPFQTSAIHRAAME